MPPPNPRTIPRLRHHPIINPRASSPRASSPLILHDQPSTITKQGRISTPYVLVITLAILIFLIISSIIGYCIVKRSKRKALERCLERGVERRWAYENVGVERRVGRKMDGERDGGERERERGGEREGGSEMRLGRQERRPASVGGGSLGGDGERLMGAIV